MDEIDDLRARVQEQQALIDDLQEKVAANEHLEARLAHLERLVQHPAGATPATPVPATAGPPPAPAVVDEDVDEDVDGASATTGTVERRTDRRQLLTKAATVAAGAVAGGTVLAVSQATPAAAASGNFDGNPAVTATAVGVTAIGVQAATTGGVGVQSFATNGIAFQAVTSSGKAFDASAGSGTALAASVGQTGTHLVLSSPQTVPPPPDSTTARSTGAVVRDSNGDLWLCVGSGTPGLWRRVSGTNTAGALTMLNAPVRVYDSRPGNPPIIGPQTPLGNGNTRTVNCALNSSGVPAGAQAVLANITVVNTSATGFLTAFKAGVAVPAASTINWYQPKTIVANTTVVACSSLTNIACYVPPNSSTDFFVDIVGYYR
ncbi:MAG: hypothetical protein U0Q07_03845 [Acidimicrobiales bacterium]